MEEPLGSFQNFRVQLRPQNEMLQSTAAGKAAEKTHYLYNLIVTLFHTESIYSFSWCPCYETHRSYFASSYRMQAVINNLSMFEALFKTEPLFCERSLKAVSAGWIY